MIQAVIVVRIGMLEPGLRALVFLAAVIGPPAPVDLVARLAGQSEDHVESAQQKLAQMGFVRAGPGGYGFRHMLMGETRAAPRPTAPGPGP